jgi:hypothetical protein
MVPPVRWCLSADDVSDSPFDFNGQQFELTRGHSESLGVAHHSTTVEENDKGVLAIEQVIDLLLNAVNVTAEHPPKSHDRNSAVDGRDWSDEPVTGWERRGVPESSVRLGRCTISAASDTRSVGAIRSSD